MRRRRLRKAVVGAGLSLAVVTGLAACGSTNKTDNSPAVPAQAPAGSTNVPTQATTPPTTAPSSGGVSY